MKTLWIAVLAVFLVLIPNAGAIVSPDVTLIPSQISMNSNFIMVADPYASASEEITSFTWIIYGTGTSGVGDFTYTKGNWMKFVTDSSLFPSPSYETPYTMEVFVKSDINQENNTVNISVGNISITSNIVVTGNNVYISAYASPEQVDSGISYKTYSDSLTAVAGKSGLMTYYPPIHGYTTDLYLSNGDYYIAFTANALGNFGGTVAKVTVGGGSGGSTGVQADSIIYNPVISPGQEFRIETFRITNTGTQNLTALSISVPVPISNYLNIAPKNNFLQPNESTYMTVFLHGIQSTGNISTFATLLSGSTELKQIPVDLRISVIGGIDPASCAGKEDTSECLGGICCSGICRKSGAECCTSSNCPSGKTCSGYKCVEATGECKGMSDMAACTGGICCEESCIAGGQCCSSSDCTTSGQTCTYRNTCESSGGGTNECEGMSDKETCTGGICCSGSCMIGGKCCSNSDCDMTTGEICSSEGVCTGGSSSGGGIDIVSIALIGGGVAAAAVVGFFLFKKFVKKKKKDEGEEDFEEGEEKEDDEFSDEDFY